MKTDLQSFDNVVIDLIVFSDSENEVLIQKRSPQRRLFPNQWDFIGGI